MFFRPNSQDAFKAAIQNGQLTENESDENFAGNFMYMHSTQHKGKLTDSFKNIDTRKYRTFEAK